MNEVFQFQIQNHRNLRITSALRITSFNATFKGKESVSYFGPKMWSQVPDKPKSLESLRSFKKQSENGKSVNVGFVGLS